MSELTIKKEKVLEAAAACPDAKKVLKTLFPEVFKPVKLPQVGQVWSLHSHPTIRFVRINDENGCKAYGGDPRTNFYSLNQYGNVVIMPNDSEDIVVLERYLDKLL